MKDTRGLWTGDYYGSVTIGYNANLVKTPPKSFADLLKPIYKNQVALNGSPLQSGSAIAGVFAAALANGGSLSERRPGRSTGSRRPGRPGNYIPVETTPQTVASGQTPISIDWDYNNFAYVKEFPAAELEGRRPVATAQYGGYYCQAVSATAPHPLGGPAVAGVHLLRPGTDPLVEGVRAPRPLHRSRRAEGDPEAADSRRCRRLAIYNKVRFASLGQQASRGREDQQRSGPRRSAR